MTLANALQSCTTNLEWRSSSLWATPHPNDLYSSEIITFAAAGRTEVCSFHISRMKLILCRKTWCSWQETPTVTYYSMGEFTEPIASSLASLEGQASKIKEYADYIINGFRKYGNLGHCPSFEIIDDVDENFNPI